MKRFGIVLAVIVLLWALLPVNAPAFQIITREMMEKETVTETDLIRNVDNFIVLFDTSGSTNEMVPGKGISKIQAAKNFLKDRNAWFPELGYQAGLYIYTDNQTLMGTFKEVVGMQAYNRETFAAGIDQLPEKGQGPTMLQAGLHGLRKVLDGLSGKTAVIMFTDGTFTVTRGPKRPLEIAREIASAHDVSFYLISSATADVNQQLLETVSSVNARSRVIPLATFIDNPHYLSGALFTVKTSSYERLRPVTRVVGVELEDIRFDFNSDDIGGNTAQLDRLGDYLRNNPAAYVVLGGYADSTGSEEYNLGLSERRANRVRDYLTTRFNVENERIATLWFGTFNPVADNSTAEGRQLNRRVEIAVGGVK